MAHFIMSVNKGKRRAVTTSWANAQTERKRAHLPIRNCYFDFNWTASSGFPSSNALPRSPLLYFANYTFVTITRLVQSVGKLSRPYLRDCALIAIIILHIKDILCMLRGLSFKGMFGRKYCLANLCAKQNPPGSQSSVIGITLHFGR